MGIQMDEVAYIGDDLNCIPLLEAVGMKACPAVAQPQVKAVAGIRVLSRRGGDACVREFIEDIILRQQHAGSDGLDARRADLFSTHR